MAWLGSLCLLRRWQVLLNTTTSFLNNSTKYLSRCETSSQTSSILLQDQAKDLQTMSFQPVRKLQLWLVLIRELYLLVSMYLTVTPMPAPEVDHQAQQWDQLRSAWAGGRTRLSQTSSAEGWGWPWPSSVRDINNFWSEQSVCAARGCWHKRRWPL